MGSKSFLSRIGNFDKAAISQEIYKVILVQRASARKFTVYAQFGLALMLQFRSHQKKPKNSDLFFTQKLD